MELDISGMPAEQKDKIKKIIMLGQQFGGTEEIDNYLMGELLGAYMPQEQAAPELDKNLLDIYKATEDPVVGKALTQDYFGKAGLEYGGGDTAEGGIDPKMMEEILKAYEQEGGKIDPTLQSTNPNIIKQGPQNLGSQYLS